MLNIDLSTLKKLDMPENPLKVARKNLGLTQNQVADILKISHRQYQRYENGEKDITEAPFQIAMNIFEILRLDPNEFVITIAEQNEFDISQMSLEND